MDAETPVPPNPDLVLADTRTLGHLGPGIAYRVKRDDLQQGESKKLQGAARINPWGVANYENERTAGPKRNRSE